MRLEDFRLNALLSQKRLAELSNLAESTIYQIETGLHKPTKLSRAKILAALSKHLGRTVEASEIEEFKNG